MVFGYSYRLIKFENFFAEMEAQPSERILVAIEERGRPSSGDAL